MNRAARDRDDRHPKPVKRIELLEKYPKARLALTIVLILVGVCALGYSLVSFMTADSGWITIEADSSEASCSDELVFQYYLGAGELSATAEKKAVSALYTELARSAYQLFHTSQGFGGVHNLYYINRHPNEEIEVDDMLYEAFSMLEKYGNRAVYLAPVYVQYDNLFGCHDDVETAAFDPYQNEEIAQYFAEVTSFAEDKGAVDVQLLGNNTVRLYVSDAYLHYAAENGFSDYIDFYWMKNAFIVDYIADTMKANGFVMGSVSSYDGFVRNIDSTSDMEYGFNLFDRVGGSVYQAAVMRYRQAMSIVYLRNYPANGSLDWQHYYEFRNGEIRTAYIDVADGYCRSAVNNLVAYSQESGCAEILLQVMPVYIRDYFAPEKLAEPAREGIYSIYCENNQILYNDAALVLTDLYDDGNGVRYRAVYSGD